MDEDSSGEDEEDIIEDDVWDLMDYEESIGSKRRRQQTSSEETAPSLPPDVEAELKDALQRGITQQRVSPEAEKDPWEVTMAPRLK